MGERPKLSPVICGAEQNGAEQSGTEPRPLARSPVVRRPSIAGVAARATSYRLDLFLIYFFILDEIGRSVGLC